MPSGGMKIVQVVPSAISLEFSDNLPRNGVKKGMPIYFI